MRVADSPPLTLRIMAWLLVGTLLPSAVAQEAPAASVSDAASGDQVLDLETLLSADEDGYPESRRCLSSHKLDKTRILDESHVLFQLRNGDYYLAQLSHRCPGLKRNSTVSFVRRSSKVCAKDSIRGIPLTGGYTPACQLPRFLPVTAEQVEMLREAIKSPMFRASKSEPIR